MVIMKALNVNNGFSILNYRLNNWTKSVGIAAQLLSWFLKFISKQAYPIHVLGVISVTLYNFFVRGNQLKWIERPPSVWDVIVSNPVADSDFFFVPCSWHADHFIFTGVE